MLFVFSVALGSASKAIENQVHFYEHRYQFQNLNQKIVDNFGDNFDGLYGTRNFREVLRGVLYRGGANNKYNKQQKRSNTNPIPNHGLENLCEEGFASAVYLYDTNFDSAKKSMRCKSFAGESASGNEFARDRQNGNSFTYHQLTAFNEENEEQFIKLIYDALTGKAASPFTCTVGTVGTHQEWSLQWHYNNSATGHQI